MPQPFLLYSSDWMVMTASLADIARRNPQACTVMLGFGESKLLHLKTGLLWSVQSVEVERGCKSRRVAVLENRTAFVAAFKHCLACRSAQFVVGLITMTSADCPAQSHLMSFVYTTSTREFEVFDPNGGLQFVSSMGAGKYEDFMRKYYSFEEFGETLKKFLKKDAGLASEVYMPVDWCPEMGIQRLDDSARSRSIESNRAAMESDFGGYCGAWSLWWITTRLARTPDPSRPAGTTRLDVLSRAMSEFGSNPVNIREWMLEYAQSLTRTTMLLMILALRIGGRSKKTARAMVRRYAAAKTYCQKAQNLAYHDPSPQNRNEAKVRCQRAGKITGPIYAEVQAHIEAAVERYSRGGASTSGSVKHNRCNTK